MKIATLLIMSVFTSCGLAKFTVETAGISAISIASSGKGTIEELYLSSDEKGSRFGPIYLWRGKTSGELVQITNSLSSLDELLRAEVTSNNVSTNLKREILYAIQIFAKAQGALLLSGKLRSEYMEVLQQKMGDVGYLKIESKLSDLSQNFENDNWQVSITSVTMRGAIERLTFRGSLSPVLSKAKTVKY